MTVALDFDAVIHGYSKGWQGGKIYDPPVAGAVEAIREIQSVEPAFVLTARMDLDAVAEWLSALGFACMTEDEWKKLHGYLPTFWTHQEILLITNRKLPARVYLDDRGVRFDPSGGWDQAMREMGLAG